MAIVFYISLKSATETFRRAEKSESNSGKSRIYLKGEG
jgi:hypothetical protein